MFCWPITERRKAKPKQKRNYFRHSIEIRSNGILAIKLNPVCTRGSSRGNLHRQIYILNIFPCKGLHCKLLDPHQYQEYRNCLLECSIPFICFSFSCLSFLSPESPRSSNLCECSSKANNYLEQLLLAGVAAVIW